MLSFISNLSGVEIALIVVSSCLYLLIGFLFQQREGHHCSTPECGRWENVALCLGWLLLLPLGLAFNTYQNFKANQRAPLPVAETLPPC